MARVSTGAGDAPRRKWKRWVFGLPLALTIPFLLLVRLSTWLYLDKGFNGWVAVGFSATAAALVLSGLVAVVAMKLGARPGSWTLKSSLVLLLVYAVYLLVFVSVANVKSADLRATYRDLHPVLRLSVSTLILLDKGAVITDTGRTPEDYVQMGLRKAAASAHYRQADGYVHAVDLRTRERGGIRNLAMQLFFEAMGFDTLRHDGTADHLHVSLAVR
jgi:hypothetical protein